MSAGREVTLNLDLQVMEEVACACGYTVKKATTVEGYYRGKPILNGKVAELVIHSPRHGFEIGINSVKGANKAEVLADFHGGYVQADLEVLVPLHHAEVLRRRGFTTEIVKEKSKVFLTVRR